ncbi:MAG: Gfo/Idh/MocA family oxidoreductase [Methanoregula sp.]|jgi:predicted dehydrogenase|uniref:Gfo/Idh/MocA family protein n=1 Tax=Methanoregula sp. TaxID=2052170 RepID=UPI003D12ABC8
MTTRKKAAIIGFGGMGQRHYTAYTKIGVDVVAISDMYPEKVSQIIPSFDKKHIYGTYEDLLKGEKGNIDILSVVTNGPTHAEVTIAGSEAGIPNILCEKPMATNLHDAKNVIETCDKNRTRLAVNHIRRWSSNYSRIKQMIGEGVIGDIRHLYFSCGSTGIGNFAIHFFDTARLLTESDPEWIMGFLDRTGTPNPRGKAFIDPGGYGIIKFKNGCRFFIDTSEDTGVQYSFQIVGTTGRIIIDELNDTWQIRGRTAESRKLSLTRYGSEMPVIPFISDAPFDIVSLTSKAMAELLSGRPVSSTGTDGLKSLELVVGLHISDHQENRKITLPLPEELYSKDIPIA